MTDEIDDAYGSKLDPRIEQTIREIASIQARLTAVELINTEIKPEIKELQKPNWPLLLSLVTGFILFIGFYTSLILQIQSSGHMENKSAIIHTEQHIRILEDDHKMMRLYTDKRDDEIVTKMYTKDEHELFDRDRRIRLDNMEERINRLEKGYIDKGVDERVRNLEKKIGR